MAQSAADLANRAVDATTTVDLSASWFRDNYAVILPIGLVMLVATFCLQLIRAAWRRDGQALAQAVTGTVSGVIFCFAALAGTSVALSVVDALSNGLFQVANTSTSDAVSRVIKVGEIAPTAGLGWGIPALIALGCVVGAFLYWGTMVFRKVAILVLVTLAIFAGAGGGWEPTQRWRRAWIEATATLVFSKLVMTIIFLIGVSAIGRSSSKDPISALSDVLAGMVVMLLVLLAPFMTYKFVHWAADGQAGELHRSASAGLSTAAGAARQAGGMAMRAGSGGARGAQGSPQGPDRVPGQDAPVGGPDPAGADAPAQTSFRYPGTAPGGSGPAASKPLITRRTENTGGGGDGGVPLVTRSANSTPPAANAPAPAAGTALAAATRVGGPPPQIVTGVPRPAPPASPSGSGPASPPPSPPPPPLA
ncbi:ATP-binding protein [Streptacidiphilus sp. MAP5-52]|uniref:SCO6881 family protein n=1 Tax=Streptacidiphilus sp. MAP5-52 TaxID=3156267 RepID=UPI00351694BB